MKVKKLKPYVLPTLYVLSFVFVFLGVYLSVLNLTNTVTEENITFVSSTIISSDIPVIVTDSIVKKPYNDAGVKIARNFYNNNGEEQEQINSIIYYQNTYMPNSGVDYNSKKDFPILSILAGTVTSVKDDELLGKTVEIKHSNNLVSVYQGLKDVKVAPNDIVTQHQQIATSGESRLNEGLGTHLHFELYHRGQVVNPEEYYGKDLKDL